MSIAERMLERITPRSTLGLTMLTLAIITLMIGFLIQDIHVPGLDEVDDESEAVASQTAVPSQPVCTHRAEPRRLGLLGSPIEDDSAENMTLASSVNPPRSVPVEPSERYSSNSTSLPRVSPGYVARLSRTCDCCWVEDAKGPKEGSQFKVGQTLHIAAGLVEIVFGCGATAIVEGPAVLELQSNKTSALHAGKLTAHVPDDLEGFTVHTPVAQVVSLAQPPQLKGVAKLTSTSDCTWAAGNAVTKEGASLLPGQTVKLASGLAEITFASGAKVILQGPASLEIESSKTATLHNGRMTADVPDDLAGFKIHTSAAEILSLPAEPKETTRRDVRSASAMATKL